MFKKSGTVFYIWNLCTYVFCIILHALNYLAPLYCQKYLREDFFINWEGKKKGTKKA
jgi:hypothetical protein